MGCIEIYNECQDILTQFEASNHAEIDNFFQLLEEFTRRYNCLKEKLPYHINVIDELHVNENANSRILAALLQYKENGEYTLLKSFVKNRLNKWDIDVSEPQITSEDLRIDLLVQEKGKYAIIFENKIYDAVHQKNQLARYIIKMRNEDFADDQIFVVFLPPQKYEPTDCSWKKPIKECEICCDASRCPIKEKESLKASFKDRFQIITFRDDIIAWLEEDVIPNCRQKETFLYTAAMQYLDYLKGYFDLRTINKNMNMELQEYLIGKLHLEDEKNGKKKLEILDKKINEIQQLLNEMQSLKNCIRQNVFDEWKQITKEKFPELHPSEKGFCTDVSIDMINGKRVIVFVSKEKGDQLCCQVMFDDNLPQEERSIENTKLMTLKDILSASNQTFIFKYYQQDDYDGVFNLFLEVVERCKKLVD
jgi:hypothetical protein